MTNEEIKKFKQGEELSLLVNFDSYTNDIKSIFYLYICVRFFNKLRNRNEDVFNHIKNKFKNGEKLIESFKNFSEVYPSIDELNQSFDDYAFNLYDEVKLIMKKTEIILA